MNIEHVLTDLFFIYGKFFAIFGFFFIAKFYVSSNFNKNVSASTGARLFSYLIAIVVSFLIGLIADSHFRDRMFEVFLALAIPACVGLYTGYAYLDGKEGRELIKRVHDEMDHERLNNKK